MTRRWTGVLARLGVPTGDGRIIAPGGITSRDLPLPLLWQELSGDGHGGSRVVGAIETLDFGDPGMIRATGSLLDSSGFSYELGEQIEAGVIGPSVDLDDIEYVMDDQERLVITQGRIAGATLVAIPAFAGVSIELEPRPEPGLEPSPEPAYDSMWASAAPAELPPSEWFSQPDLDRVTPLTVTDTGRVFGHIAPWGQCHVGLPGCVTAPSSASQYAYFHQGEQQTREGVRLPVGTLTVGGGHAEAGKGWRAAMEHYDNVGAAVAKVVAGEDEFGIWVAGWMLPQATEEQREVFRSSPVSGDWRRVGGSLELVAVCSVNSAGFPVPRARVSFSAELGQRSLTTSFGIKAQARDDLGGTAKVTDSRARWAWFTQTEG